MRDPYLPPKAYKLVHNWWLRLLIWRERHIKEKNLVLVLSLAVGLAAGFAAMILKWLIHVISGSLMSDMSVSEGNYMYIIYPVVGVLLACWYVRYVVRDNISHGVTRVLYSISQNKSRLKPHNMYTSIMASSITIGFGGSVGAEGPIVYTGAAIGSNLGQAFRLSPRVLMILVGCGAAAGIAGIFKAPIAGMLFTLEVLMLDLTTSDSLYNSRIGSIHFHRIRPGILFRSERAIHNGASPLFHRTWHNMRSCFALFHPGDVHDGDFFQKTSCSTMAEDIGRMRHTCNSRIPFPSALR